MVSEMRRTERVPSLELTERNCHRLKAVLREVSVKCIRESIWRTRAASSQVRDYTRYVYQGGGYFVHGCPL